MKLRLAAAAVLIRIKHTVDRVGILDRTDSVAMPGIAGDGIADRLWSRQLVLVTNNEKEFRRVGKLKVENWV